MSTFHFTLRTTYENGVVIDYDGTGIHIPYAPREDEVLYTVPFVETVIAGYNDNQLMVGMQNSNGIGKPIASIEIIR